jgi:hypothetical protein
MSRLITMSRRTPQYSACFNSADNIESYLQEDGHRTWGFVIYRCTYESDDDWGRFMERLRDTVRSALETYNGLDMMDSLSITVFEDRPILDGASTSVIREHFKQWAVTASRQEQGTGPALSQRYRYCVQVDAVALKSVIYDALWPLRRYTISDGLVNLIWRDWEPYTPDPREAVEEPIEGCTLNLVGWMRVAYQDVMVDMYYYLRDWNAWHGEYRRPPEVAHA